MSGCASGPSSLAMAAACVVIGISRVREDQPSPPRRRSTRVDVTQDDPTACASSGRRWTSVPDGRGQRPRRRSSTNYRGPSPTSASIASEAFRLHAAARRTSCSRGNEADKKAPRGRAKKMGDELKKRARSRRARRASDKNHRRREGPQGSGGSRRGEGQGRCQQREQLDKLRDALKKARGVGEAQRGASRRSATSSRKRPTSRRRRTRRRTAARTTKRRASRRREREVPRLIARRSRTRRRSASPIVSTMRAVEGGRGPDEGISGSPRNDLDQAAGPTSTAMGKQEMTQEEITRVTPGVEMMPRSAGRQRCSACVFQRSARRAAGSRAKPGRQQDQASSRQGRRPMRQASQAGRKMASRQGGQQVRAASSASDAAGQATSRVKANRPGQSGRRRS